VTQDHRANKRQDRDSDHLAPATELFISASGRHREGFEPSVPLLETQQAQAQNRFAWLPGVFSIWPTKNVVD
jgi:hypothetical protein